MKTLVCISYGAYCGNSWPRIFRSLPARYLKRYGVKINSRWDQHIHWLRAPALSAAPRCAAAMWRSACWSENSARPWAGGRCWPARSVEILHGDMSSRFARREGGSRARARWQDLPCDRQIARRLPDTVRGQGPKTVAARTWLGWKTIRVWGGLSGHLNLMLLLKKARGRAASSSENWCSRS